ncbi:MAG TPA: MFS transporter, partial [Vicinamibacteria bacterium]|nr:MFS transporter [Vicinamibacteria bacterium]
MPPLPSTVRRLGLVSLLTDASSEMIYPLLPSFMTGVLGAGPAFVGLVEGLAESVASLAKVVSGAVSDRMRRRKPLIVGGYSLSSCARPLVAVAAAPWHVLAVRIVDRIGKGVRGAPRDALLAQVTPREELGRAFGFQRAMDHAGAVVGPLLASALLLLHLDLRTVFALAAVPALACVIVLVFGVREAPRESTDVEPSGPAADGDSARAAAASPGLGRLLAVIGLFTLGNSSDAFLLLRAQDAGVALPLIPLLWTAHHVVKSAASTAGGALSDRVGRRAAIATGWFLYAIAYAGLGLATSPGWVWVLFAVYGLHHALTEGPERALVAETAAGGRRGRAFGLYHAITGALLLPASLLTGALWQRFSPAAALLTGATLALLASALLLLHLDLRT